MTRNIILFDLDNTLADMDHRLHLIDRQTADWDAFEDASVDDIPLLPSILAARAASDHGLGVWIWTGRSDRVRGATEQWLVDHDVPYDQLIMRPYGDYTDTVKLKQQWLNDAPVPRARVLCAYDDDRRIVDMLIGEGLLVYKVTRK